jgi:hypothetical protein
MEDIKKEENFDIEFKELYRNIYFSSDLHTIYNVIRLISHIIINEDIIKHHKNKENIRNIINKELTKINGMQKIYKFYTEKIENIFSDNKDEEYDII